MPLTTEERNIMIPTIFYISRKGVNIHWMEDLEEAIEYARDRVAIGGVDITVTDENGIEYYNSSDEYI